MAEKPKAPPHIDKAIHLKAKARRNGQSATIAATHIEAQVCARCRIQDCAPCEVAKILDGLKKGGYR